MTYLEFNLEFLIVHSEFVYLVQYFKYDEIRTAEVDSVPIIILCLIWYYFWKNPRRNPCRIRRTNFWRIFSKDPWNNSWRNLRWHSGSILVGIAETSAKYQQHFHKKTQLEFLEEHKQKKNRIPWRNTRRKPEENHKGILLEIYEEISREIDRQST